VSEPSTLSLDEAIALAVEWLKEGPRGLAIPLRIKRDRRRPM
jgi:hypothetical protein